MKTNKDLKLPADNITVVHRSDGSGTTFIFTNYLSKVSAEWKSTVGESTAVSWKAGIGGKGNEGVAANVQRMKNTIGYVEYAYALQNKMTFTQMKNREGQFVSPSDVSFKAAAVKKKDVLLSAQIPIFLLLQPLVYFSHYQSLIQSLKTVNSNVFNLKLIGKKQEIHSPANQSN